MVYVFLAQGFEEMEALTPVDILRRAGVKVKTVSVEKGNTVCGSHNIAVTADINKNELDLSDAEAIVLPGGMPGTLNLKASECVRNAVNYCNKNNLLIGAICAAPSILGEMGILNGKNAVCFPGFEDKLLGATLCKSIVCTDGNIITGKGAGAALDFSLALLKYLSGEQTAEKTEGALMRI